MKNKYNGLLVRGQNLELATDTGEQSKAGADEQPEKLSNTCFLVTAPKFQKVIMIKTFNDVSKDKSEETIVKSIENQFQALKSQHGLKPDDIVLVLLVKKLKESKEKLEKQLPKELQHEFGTNILKVLRDIDKTAPQNQSSRILNFVRDQKKRSDLQLSYQITKKEFHCGGEQKSNLQSKEEISILAETHFPKRKEKLVFVPDIDKICENLLYKTTSGGTWKEIEDWGSYYGEVTLFIQKYIVQLDMPTGVMLKSFCDKHFETVLDARSEVPGNFEIDWLYLGPNKIIAIEIGLSKSIFARCDHTASSDQLGSVKMIKSAVLNKFSQIFTKIFPRFHYIIHSLCRFYGKESDFTGILDRNFSVLTIFPNISKKKFKKVLKDVRNGKKEELKETRDLIKDNKKLLGCLHFAFKVDLKQNSSTNLFRLSEDLTLQSLETSFSQNFRPANLSSENEMLETIKNILSLSSLNFLRFESKEREKVDTSDIDDRYRTTFSFWKENQKSLTYNSLDFILSPEQHAILSDISDDMRCVVLRSEPGCGKTSLLLAKCQILAEGDEVSRIFYVVPDNRTILIDKLETIIAQCGCAALRDKIEIKRLHLSTKIEDLQIA